MWKSRCALPRGAQNPSPPLLVRTPGGQLHPRVGLLLGPALGGKMEGRGMLVLEMASLPSVVTLGSQGKAVSPLREPGCLWCG